MTQAPAPGNLLWNAFALSAPNKDMENSLPLKLHPISQQGMNLMVTDCDATLGAGGEEIVSCGAVPCVLTYGMVRSNELGECSNKIWVVTSQIGCNLVEVKPQICLSS